MSECRARQIATAFDAQFLCSHGAQMRGGGVEPLYLPPTATTCAQLVYTRDYPASALHEAAHWCLAGARRRGLRDYGYWYVPGPRNAEQRAAFFAAECEVQALEAVFAAAARVRFVISADDFDAPLNELARFAVQVQRRAAAFLSSGMPPRARQFYARLLSLARSDG